MVNSNGSPGRHNRYECLGSDDDDDTGQNHVQKRKNPVTVNNSEKNDQQASPQCDPSKTVQWDGRITNGKRIPYVDADDEDETAKKVPSSGIMSKKILRMCVNRKKGTRSLVAAEPDLLRNNQQRLEKYRSDIERAQRSADFDIKKKNLKGMALSIKEQCQMREDEKVWTELTNKARALKERHEAQLAAKAAKREAQAREEKEWALVDAKVKAATKEKLRKKVIAEQQALESVTASGDRRWGDDPDNEDDAEDDDDKKMRDIQLTESTNTTTQRTMSTSANSQSQAATPTAPTVPAPLLHDGRVVNDLSLRAEFNIPRGNPGEVITFQHIVEMQKLALAILAHEPLTRFQSIDGTLQFRTPAEYPRQEEDFKKFFTVTKHKNMKVIIGFRLRTRRLLSYFKKEGSICRNHLNASRIFIRAHNHSTYNIHSIGFIVGKCPDRTNALQYEKDLHQYLCIKLANAMTTTDDAEAQLVPSLEVVPNKKIIFIQQGRNGENIKWETQALEIRCERHNVEKVRTMIVNASIPHHRFGLFTPYKIQHDNVNRYIESFSEQNHMLNNRKVIVIRGLQERFLDRVISSDDDRQFTVRDALLDRAHEYTDAMGSEHVTYPIMGFERTPRTRTAGEWIIITTTRMEQAANKIFDSIMAEHVEPTSEYLEDRALDGISGYGIGRMNDTRARRDPLLLDYTDDMGAYLANMRAAREDESMQVLDDDSATAPKRQPNAKPARIELTVLDTSDFPVLQPIPQRESTNGQRTAGAVVTPETNAWKNNMSTRSIHSQCSDTTGTNQTLGSDNSPNGTDHLSAITMDTISTMFNEYAVKQRQQFEEYSQQQDKKLETIVRMSLESNAAHISGLRNESGGRESMMERLVETSQLQVQKLASIIEKQQAENAQGQLQVQRLTAIIEQQHAQNTELMRTFRTAAIAPHSQKPPPKETLPTEQTTPTPQQEFNVSKTPRHILTVPPAISNPYRIRRAEIQKLHKGKMPRHDTDDVEEDVQSLVGKPTSPDRLAAQLMITSQQLKATTTRDTITPTPFRAPKRNDAPPDSPSTVNSFLSASSNSQQLRNNAKDNNQNSPSNSYSPPLQEVDRSRSVRADPRKND